MTIEINQPVEVEKPATEPGEIPAADDEEGVNDDDERRAG